jgi:hypothetical protein
MTGIKTVHRRDLHRAAGRYCLYFQGLKLNDYDRTIPDYSYAILLNSKMHSTSQQRDRDQCQGDYPRAFVVFDEPQTQPIGYPFACGEGGMSCGHATVSESMRTALRLYGPAHGLPAPG